ncbi:T9SS type A sorting domain-containing protein [Bacteroidota bacterium]
MKKLFTTVLLTTIILFSSFLNTSAEDNWQQITGGPFGGMVLKVAQGDNLLFAGTLDGGLYMSSDYGDNWSYISEGLPFLDIQELLYHDNRLFAAHNEHGIYISDDLGETWILANNGITNPSISSIVALDGNLYCSTRGDGVFFSSDKGDSWEARNEGMFGLTVNNLIVFRNVIYAATGMGIYWTGNQGVGWTSILESGNFYHVAVNENYIFIATNYQVWMTSNNGLDWDMAEYGYGLGNGYIYDLISTGPYVIAGRSAGFFVSNFLGGEWVNVNSSLSRNRVYSIIRFNNIFYAGTSKGVFYSQDYGGNWKESNNGMLSERILAIEFNNDIMYAGLEDNGVIMSTDLGNTWEDMNLGNKRVSTLYWSNNGLYVVADDTLYFTSNNGIQWNYRYYGFQGNSVNCIAKYGDAYYAGTNDGIYISMNLGESWFFKDPVFKGLRIRSIYVDENNDIFIATDDKLYLSRDDGNTWSTTSDGMESSYNITYITGNDSLLVVGSYPGTLFDADIYLSDDRGLSWISSDLKFSDKYIHDIVVQGEIIFASARGTGSNESLGILFSSNSGKSWYEFNDGLRAMDIADLIIHQDVLFAGSMGAGIYRTAIPEPLYPPALLYPGDNSKNIIIQPMLDWETIDGVASYLVQISDRFDNFEKHIISEESTTVSEYKVLEGILSNNTQYFWRVNYTKDGRQSDWTEIYNFTTEGELITITTLLSPDDNAVDVSVMAEFEWEELPEASDYIIQVSTSESFTDNAIDITVAANNYVAPKGKLEFNTHYFWRVRAIIYGAERDWSDISGFTTLELNLILPELIYPLDGAAEIPVTDFLEWQSVANADEYILQVSEDDAFTIPVVNDTISETIYNFVEGILKYETGYFWRVKAKYMNYESEWSETRSFTTTFEVSVEDNQLLAECDLKVTPNPVNDNFTISYSLPFETPVTLILTDINAKKIKTLTINNKYIPGNEERFTGTIKDLSSGVYLIIAKTNLGSVSRKFVIQK